MQIKPYYDEVGKPDTAEYRSHVTEYTVNTDNLEVAWGNETFANPQYGMGGKPQYFIDNIEAEIAADNLTRGKSHDLYNYKISSDEYDEMIERAQKIYEKNNGGKNSGNHSGKCSF